MCVCVCWWCSTAPHPRYQPGTDTLHTAAPPAAVDTTRDPDDRGAPALQMDKPTRAFHPQQETQEGVTQEVHRSEQGGDWKHTHVWTYFSTSYGLSCIQTDCETLLNLGHESTLTITSVKSICPQNSYSKMEMFHFSVIHNQSNFLSRKHLDTAVSCYAAPLVDVWPLASMLNQLHQIPNHLRHDFLPQMHVLWV